MGGRQGALTLALAALWNSGVGYAAFQFRTMTPITFPLNPIPPKHHVTELKDSTPATTSLSPLVSPPTSVLPLPNTNESRDITSSLSTSSIAVDTPAILISIIGLTYVAKLQLSQPPSSTYQPHLSARPLPPEPGRWTLDGNMLLLLFLFGLNMPLTPQLVLGMLMVGAGQLGSSAGMFNEFS